jgi:hypothetical protein
MHFILLFLAVIGLSRCNSGFDPAGPSTSNCATLNAASIGTVNVAITASNATLDWTNDLSLLAESYSVSLVGPGVVTPVTGTKPASFGGLADGSWIALVEYAKPGCASKTAAREFTINSAVDCTNWNTQSVGTVSVTNTAAGAVSVNWSGTVLASDSFSVAVSGNTTPAGVATKPAAFSGLNTGSHSAHVSYVKAGCSDKTGTQVFTVPVSLATNIFPVLSAKCSSCHGANGGFTVGSNSTALYGALTGAHSASCAPAAANATRVDSALDPAAPTGAFFYRKISGSGCGTNMGSTGGLSAGEIAIILTWISEGASNN